MQTHLATLACNLPYYAYRYQVIVESLAEKTSGIPIPVRPTGKNLWSTIPPY